MAHHGGFILYSMLRDRAPRPPRFLGPGLSRQWPLAFAGGFAVCIARGAAQLNWRRCAPQLGRHVGVARPGRALHPLSGCVDRPVPIRRCGPRTNGIAAIKRPGEIPGQNGVNSEMGPSSDGSKARRLTPRSPCGMREEAEQAVVSALGSRTKNGTRERS